MDVSPVVARLRAATAEKLALGAAAAAALVAAGVALLVFLIGDHRLDIAGDRSVGQVTAIAGAAATALAYAGGRVAVLRSPHVGPRLEHRSRSAFAVAVFETAAVALAHALVIGLVWTMAADILSRSFAEAPVYALEAVAIVGPAVGLSAYIAFSSAVHMTPMLLSSVLTVFLTVGAMTSMLTASDRFWWKENLSSLGTHLDLSGLTFNATLVVAGVLVTAMARMSTLHPGRFLTRGEILVRVALIALGVLLACVGLVPVNVSVLIHNTVATGMAVVFCALAVGIRWALPRMPFLFVAMGWAIVAAIGVSAVLFAVGYYNLTAVELVASLAIFAWIIVFLRVFGALQSDAA
ncbi:hypothetical protein [Leifsonia shinshuensis]|uniref:hypothetical protein n=1 Tax=Leifsonia shinshuensis TaxID=150026 RepID=UPI00285B8524|nr:hypothetical protein [Leifsonia shinshuensis]MDR6971046.1 hypothetical protein [Leifsonia shinshuensis]